MIYLQQWYPLVKLGRNSLRFLSPAKIMHQKLKKEDSRASADANQGTSCHLPDFHLAKDQSSQSQVTCLLQSVHSAEHYDRIPSYITGHCLASILPRTGRRLASQMSQRSASRYHMADISTVCIFGPFFHDRIFHGAKPRGRKHFKMEKKQNVLENKN